MSSKMLKCLVEKMELLIMRQRFSRGCVFFYTENVLAC